MQVNLTVNQVRLLIAACWSRHVQLSEFCAIAAANEKLAALQSLRNDLNDTAKLREGLERLVSRPLPARSDES